MIKVFSEGQIREEVKYECFKFPCGEMHVRLIDPDYIKVSEVGIHFDFERTEEVIELLLLVDSLRNEDVKVGALYMPYVPFSRQDRVAVQGDCFSLKVFANLINSLNIPYVFVTDPHSDVTSALINNIQIWSQSDVFHEYFAGKKDFYLISPDAGASKKIYSLSKYVDCIEVVECSKTRDPKTGEIKGIRIPLLDFNGKDCYIVDDIVDGGRTFIEIAKILKKRNCGKVVLMVSHGFFTKGLEVFDGLIDEIYTRKGKMK